MNTSIKVPNSCIDTSIYVPNSCIDTSTQVPKSCKYTSIQVPNSCILVPSIDVVNAELLKVRPTNCISP